MESPACRSILFLICYVLYCAMKRHCKETKEILMLALPVGDMSGSYDEHFLSDEARQVRQPQTVPGCCGRTE